MTEILFASFALVYGLVGLFLLIYTDRLSKQIKQHEEDKKKHRLEFDCPRDECKVIDAPTDDLQPLLGVVSPKPPRGKND